MAWLILHIMMNIKVIMSIWMLIRILKKNRSRKKKTNLKVMILYYTRKVSIFIKETNMGNFLVDRTISPPISKWSQTHTKLITNLPSSWQTNSRRINHFKKIRIIIWWSPIKLKKDANWSVFTVREDTKIIQLRKSRSMKVGIKISNNS